MNVRRMTMLPVEEMRKISQMVGLDDETAADVPESPAPEAEAPKPEEEAKPEEASAEATVTVPPAEEAKEEKKE